MKFKIFSVITSISIIFIVLSCCLTAYASQSNLSETKEIENVSVSSSNSQNEEIKIGKGEKVTDFSGKDIYTSAKSSNDAVCAVSDDFVITGVSEGSATITFYLGESIEHAVKVTVCKKADFKLNYSQNMAVGQKQQIRVVFTKDTYSRYSQFKSSDTSVLTVDRNGIATAKKVGTAKITYTPYTGESKSVTVTVKKMPSSISVSATQKTLTEGQSFNMNGRVESSAYQTTVFYSTTNRNIASVSSSGKVTAVSEGKAVITAYTDNGLSKTCVVYVYGKNSISLNQTATKISMDYDNVTKVVYGKSVMGKNLEAFVIDGGGNNSKTIFCTFAVHGFEDAYSKDGKVLVSAGNYAVEYFAKNPDALYNYRLVIVPCANPDGTIDGVNNQRACSTAFGRCTAAHVDMNRDFISGSFKAQESRALKDLMYDYKMSIYIDFHGWLNTVLGDSNLVDIFRSTAGLSRDQSGSYGTSQGYIIGWVKQNLGARSALVEFKSPSSLKNSSVVNGISRAVSGSINRPTDIVVKYSDSIPAVKNVVCESKTDYSLSLKWDNVSGAKGYQVQVYKNGKWEFAANVFLTNKCTVSGLQSGQDYKIRVKAFYISGNVRTYSNNYSNEYTFSVMPHKVYGLRCVSKSNDATQIGIAWNTQLDADGYSVFAQINGEWVLCDVLEGGATSTYTFTEAVPSTAYNFKVTAYSGDTSNHSYASDMLTAISACEPIDTPPTAITLSETKISVNWKTVDCDGYVVQWSTEEDFSSNCSNKYINSASSNSYSFTVDKYSYNYYVRVRSWSKVNGETTYGAWTEPVKPLTDKAYKVMGLYTAGRGDDSARIRLAWDAQNGTDEYKIYQKINGKFEEVGTSSTNEFNVTGLHSGWEYHFKVSAVKNGKEGELSDEFHTVAACASPTGFTVEAVSDNQISVEWDAGSAHGYYLEWSTDPTFKTNKQSANLVGVNNTSKTITVNGNAGDYYVRVRLWRYWEDGYVYGSFSQAERVYKVTGLYTAGRGDDGARIRLAWNAVDGVTEYNIYQKISGKYEQIGTSKTTDFNATELHSGWEYYFKVSAIVDGKEVGMSDEFHTVAACASPTGFTVEAVSENQISVKWDAGSAHGYYLEWSTDPTFKTNKQSANLVGVNNTSKTITVNGNAGDYYVRVRLWRYWEDGYVYGSFSQAERVYKVTGLYTAGRGGEGSTIRLAWNAVDGATEYKIYKKVSGKYEPIGTTETTNFNAENLHSGWEYYFKVSAMVDGEEVGMSDEFHTVAACASPTGLTAKVVSDNEISVTWDVGSAHGYYLEWSTDPTFETNQQSANLVGVNNTSRTIKVNSNADEYYVRVRLWRYWEDGYVYGSFSQALKVEK